MNLSPKEIGLRIFLLLSALWFGLAQAPLNAAEPDFLAERWVAILSAYPDFDSAKADAVKLAKSGGIPFWMDGRVYDKKRGLIYPDNFEDEIFAGNYLARRNNETEIKGTTTEYLSVERSDGYEGFRPGYYIVIAGIYGSAGDASKQVNRFKKLAPTGYSKKTKIYMGCMH